MGPDGLRLLPLHHRAASHGGGPPDEEHDAGGAAAGGEACAREGHRDLQGRAGAPRRPLVQRSLEKEE